MCTDPSSPNPQAFRCMRIWAIISIVFGRARKSITPVLNHADHFDPGWWPQFFIGSARVERSLSHGTWRQSVPDSTSASGTDANSAYLSARAGGRPLDDLRAHQELRAGIARRESRGARRRDPRGVNVGHADVASRLQQPENHLCLRHAVLAECARRPAEAVVVARPVARARVLLDRRQLLR